MFRKSWVVVLRLYVNPIRGWKVINYNRNIKV